MARKSTAKTEPEIEQEDEELVLEPEPRVAKVTERKLTTREYFETDPPAVEEAQEQPEKDWFEDFLIEHGGSRALRMTVYHLPLYDQNHNASTTAERTWVTEIKLSTDTKDNYRQTVQAFFPAGGWFNFEVKDSGRPVKSGRWVEKIAPLPNQPAAPAPGAPIIVNPQAAAAPVDPMSTVKPVFSLMKDLVGFAKEMLPAPAPVSPATNGSADKPLGQVLVEGALVKLVESDKVPADKLMEIISPVREPSFWESGFLQEAARGAFGPGGAITTIADAFSQRIKMQTQVAWLEAQTRARQAGIDPGQAATAVQAGAGEGSTTPAQIPGGAESPPQPDAPPLTDDQKMQRAYLRTASRIIDDCMEGAAVYSAAESIVDLISRYEPLRPLVDALLVMEPGKVFESFAQIAPSQEVARTVFNLAKSQLNIDWLRQLQERAKELIQEWEAENQKEEAGA